MIPATILYTGFVLSPKATPTTITARVSVRYVEQIETAFNGEKILRFEDARHSMQFNGRVRSYRTGHGPGGRAVPITVEVMLSGKPRRFPWIKEKTK